MAVKSQSGKKPGPGEVVVDGVVKSSSQAANLSEKIKYYVRRAPKSRRIRFMAIGGLTVLVVALVVVWLSSTPSYVLRSMTKPGAAFDEGSMENGAVQDQAFLIANDAPMAEGPARMYSQAIAVYTFDTKEPGDTSEKPAKSTWKTIEPTVVKNGGSIVLETRSSSDAEHWSAYAAVGDDGVPKSEIGRYLQVKAILKPSSNEAAESPVLNSVTITYEQELTAANAVALQQLKKPATQYDQGSLANAKIAAEKLTITGSAGQGSGGGAALTQMPTQPGTFVYNDGGDVAKSFAKPGALIVAGRVNYNRQSFKEASQAGATVLIYLDVVLHNNWGPYHKLLYDASECGPAAAKWPTGRMLNAYGAITDFRPGSVVQSKLECVLEKMVQDNPHMAGFFADDLGTRTWNDWSSWPAAEKQEFRDGAIAALKTFRKVADKYGLFVMVNGTWNANDGGGYPNASKHGASLADGALVEHHDRGAFWEAVLSSDQWASESPLTQGKPFHFVLPGTNSSAALQQWADTKNVAWANLQWEYGSTASDWRAFHATGLPTQVGGTTQAATDSATYTFDSQDDTAQWQQVVLEANTRGGSISVETRTSKDAKTWSPYSKISSNNTIASPIGRYLQIKLTLSGVNVNTYPEVISIAANYAVEEVVEPNPTPVPVPVEGCVNTEFNTVFPMIQSEAAWCGPDENNQAEVVSDTAIPSGKAVKLANKDQYSEYVFTVPAGQGGDYVTRAHVRGTTGTQYTLRLSDQPGTGVMAIDQAKSAPTVYNHVSLPAIKLQDGQIVKIRVTSPNADAGKNLFVDYLEFVKASSAEDPGTSPGSPVPDPGSGNSDPGTPAAPDPSAFPTRVQAEDFTPSSGMNTRMIQDSRAVSGQLRGMMTNGSIARTFNAPISTNGSMVYYVFRIAASGTQCVGAPSMSVLIDGRTEYTTTVSNTNGPASFYLVRGLSAGNHELRISYTNDYSAPGCDRNLYIDEVDISYSTGARCASTSGSIVNDSAGQNSDSQGTKVVRLRSGQQVNKALPVTATDTYKIIARAKAVSGSSATLRLFIDGQPAGDVRLNGSYTWPAWSKRLERGTHTVQFQVISGNAHIDNIAVQVP